MEAVRRLSIRNLKIRGSTEENVKLESDTAKKFRYLTFDNYTRPNITTHIIFMRVIFTHDANNALLNAALSESQLISPHSLNTGRVVQHKGTTMYNPTYDKMKNFY